MAEWSLIPFIDCNALRNALHNFSSEFYGCYVFLNPNSTQYFKTYVSNVTIEHGPELLVFSPINFYAFQKNLEN